MIFVVGFQALKFLAVIEKVNELRSIDFKKTNGKVELGKVSQFLNNLDCCKQILTWDPTIRGTHHGEGLS
jgi:hypothetical protein